MKFCPQGRQAVGATPRAPRGDVDDDDGTAFGFADPGVQQQALIEPEFRVDRIGGSTTADGSDEDSTMRNSVPRARSN